MAHRQHLQINNQTKKQRNKQTNKQNTTRKTNKQIKETAGEQWGSLNRHLEKIDFANEKVLKMAEKGKLHQVLAGGASSDEEGSPKTKKPKVIKNLLTGKSKDHDDDDDRDDEEEEEDPEEKKKKTEEDKVLTDSKKMSSITSRNLLSFNTLVNTFKKSGFAVPAKTKAAMKLIERAQAVKGELDNLIINNAQAPKMKARLDAADEANKSLVAEQANIKKVLAADSQSTAPTRAYKE